MANKRTSEPMAEPAIETTPEQTNTPEYIEVGQLRTKLGISRAVFAGVCAAEGWKSGKSVTEVEFLAAVKKFTSGPMSGAGKKEAAK